MAASAVSVAFLIVIGCQESTKGAIGMQPQDTGAGGGSTHNAAA